MDGSPLNLQPLISYGLKKVLAVIQYWLTTIFDYQSLLAGSHFWLVATFGWAFDLSKLATKF